MSNFWGAYQYDVLISVSTRKYFSKYEVNTSVSTRTYTREYEVLISVSTRKYFCMYMKPLHNTALAVLLSKFRLRHLHE